MSMRGSMRVENGTCDCCLAKDTDCVYIVGAVMKHICIDCIRYINGLVAIHYHRGG